MWPCIVTNFLIIKPTRCTNFTNFFWHETLHVSVSSSVHHKEFIHCPLSNGICHTGLQTAFEQDQDGTAVPSWSCSKAVCTVPVWHIKLLSLQWISSWWWTDELSETCRVSCQNKFVKLVHLVGFIIKKFIRGLSKRGVMRGLAQEKCSINVCNILHCVTLLDFKLSYVVSWWSALHRRFDCIESLETDITFILFVLVVPSLIVWQIIRLRSFHSCYSNGSLMMKWNSVVFPALWIKSSPLAWFQTVNLWRSNWQLY